MANMTDYLLQLQALTKTNLEILQALNQSFTSNKSHLAINVNDTTYAIPSFITLENKVNALQENFENLVHAPASGEAYFNFDGDSRAIEVRSYTQAPNRLALNLPEHFHVSSNDIFKDFLTPVPYVNFSLAELPNDITTVNVKKVIPRTDALISRFKSLLGESNVANVDYSTIYKILSVYKEDIDYIDYDTVMTLPIRKNVGTGVYVIEKIISDVIDVDMDEYITIKFRSDLPEYSQSLTYKTFDETIQKSLKVGDELVTYDGSAKMVITNIQTTTNTMEVKLMHGEYLNLVESGKDDEISDYSKIKFFSPVDFDSDKYINIPLEEDRYVFVAVSALNSRMNVQGSWGTGVVMNTWSLINEAGIDFKSYYDNNVKNIGDILFEITSIMSNTLTKYTGDEFDRLNTAVPHLSDQHIQVTHINKHLNNSTTVKNIRSLYSQKKTDNAALSEIQTKIDEINNKLATISFDDTSNIRSAYTQQLTEYNTKKNELITSITKTIDAISVAVNESEVPIENAKYRIRGFFDVQNFANQINIDVSHIKGIQVQYRYKNVSMDQGTAMSIGGEDGKLFIFSDWNIMQGFLNPRIAEFESGNYKFKAQDYNGNINEPSFNQIDIPISQGETVDIRLKVIYDFGYPFVETSSGWSEIMNIEFPSEFLKDIQILDIISENNNDIETNRFKNILEERGIPAHIDDKIVDQDLVYYHKPESIASGFYTAERRIIPLKDKLETMNTSITQLRDEIMGSSADNIQVSISIGDVVNRLHAFQDNQIHVEAWREFGVNSDESEDNDNKQVDGIYTVTKNGNDYGVSTILNLILTNTSEHTMKIYSMFPGNRDTSINEVSSTRFDKDDYSLTTEVEDESGNTEKIYNGVWIHKSKTSDNGLDRWVQSCNQIITFRLNDPYDSKKYYTEDASFTSSELSVKEENQTLFVYENGTLSTIHEGMVLYPMVRDKYSLCLDSNSPKSFITIAPGSQMIVPIIVEYKIPDGAVTKTMSFDIRTSLYQDPINYTFSVTAKNANSTQDKLISTTRKSYGLKDVNTSGWIKYNSTEVK